MRYLNNRVERLVCAIVFIVTFLCISGCSSPTSGDYYKISSFMPQSAQVGDAIEIFGFFRSPDDEVFFSDDVKAVVSVQGQFQKTVIVPEGAQTGRITVVIIDYNNNRIVRESQEDFVVLPAN